MTRDQLVARRKALGFTQQTLALTIGAERTTVARWERAESDVSAHHREPLATALGWSLTELDDALNGAGRLPIGQGGWWHTFVTLEQSATQVRSWEPVLIPGLLQTREYATALLGESDEVIRRLDRQRMLTRPGNPVELVALIDESVLLRPIGGAGVLVGQLDHLVAMSERQNVTVQVLPLDAQAHPASWGAMLIIGFPWSGGLVYLQHRDGATYLDSQHDVEAHVHAHNQLRELALSPTESLDRIRHVGES